jgi:hypothetical protein
MNSILELMVEHYPKKLFTMSINTGSSQRMTLIIGEGSITIHDSSYSFIHRLQHQHEIFTNNN